MAPSIQSVPFSNYEKTYLYMARASRLPNKEHCALHCVCSIEYSDGRETLVQLLRNAWVHLAIENPSLLVRPVEFMKIHTPLSEDTVDKWVNDTFFVHPAKSADEFIPTADAYNLPRLYFMPASHEIVFLSQHWRTDGLGCLALLDRLFDLIGIGQASSPASFSGQKHAQISPSLEIVANSSLVDDAAVMDYARQCIDERHAQVLSGLPFDGDATRQPAASTHSEICFTVEETEKIISVCKRQKISVSAAVHVAVAQAWFAVAPINNARRTACTIIVGTSLRPFLTEPYRDREHACQNYVASITPTVRQGDDPMESARRLTKEYHSWCDERLLKSLAWLHKYNLERIEKMFAPQAASASPQRLPPSSSSITLSSLGVIERHLKRDYGHALKIDSFRFGMNMMTRQTLIYVWTFRGKMTISLNYNEAYYAKPVTEDVLSKMKSALTVALAI